MTVYRLCFFIGTGKASACQEIISILTIIYMNYDKRRHNPFFCDKVVFERREKEMQNVKTTIKKAIASMAKRSAGMEANTACPCLGFQPKEPQAVKKLRKF